jgi:hypothetical protein
VLAHFLAARVHSIYVCLQPRAKERKERKQEGSRGAFSQFMLGTRACCRVSACMFWKRKKYGDLLSRAVEAFERVYQVNNEDMFAFRRVLLCARSFLQQMENACSLLLKTCGSEKMKFPKLYSAAQCS